MKKKILMGSIIAVAIIVLSSFSSVVGKVSSDEEFVEFDVEFCGLNKRQTVQLTQQEADEVELLFDEIRTKLDNVESRDKTEVIFKDAVVELDKYGLLGGLSVYQAQRLVTRNYAQSKEVKRILPDNDSNYLCLIAGKTANSVVLGPVGVGVSAILMGMFYSILLLPLPEQIKDFIKEIIFFVGLLILPQIFVPIEVGAIITFGHFIMGEPSTDKFYPAKGWTFTCGLNGIKYWQGSYWGDCPQFLPYTRIGSIGFIGIKIPHISFTNGEIGSYYLGSSLLVKMSYDFWEH